MEFGWSATQREVHERMRELGARANEAEPDARMRLLAEGGALGLPIARELGGGGLDLVTTAYAYEGLGATLADGGVLLAAGAHLFGVALLVSRVGTQAQQNTWLSRFADGSAMATVAATEDQAGSDIASVRTSCAEVGDGFRVTGHKRFVTYADRADVFFVVGDSGRRRVTALLVPRTASGVRIGEALRTAGLAGARLASVEFDACDVGPEALLGRAGAGLAVFQMAMTLERALVLAFRLGAMDRALAQAVEFARTREVGGVIIARHQAVSHRIARMKLRLETARLLVYRAAWALDRGERAQAEAALAKWHLADCAIASSVDAFHLRGGAGYLEESGLPAAIDDALGGSVHSGTQDVLATIVARWLGV